MRVLAAMSGGVDSAVAAARAVDAGHDVVGVHLALSSDRAAGNAKGKGCCTIADSHDARRAADIIGIPFYIWDMAAEFRDAVLDTGTRCRPAAHLTTIAVNGWTYCCSSTSNPTIPASARL